jgi:excisionase family DNA binding protein
MSTNVVPITARAWEAPDARAGARQELDLDSLPMLLAVPQAARLLGISRSAAYRLAGSGDLPSRRLGGRIYIITAKLFQMMEAA